MVVSGFKALARHRTFSNDTISILLNSWFHYTWSLFFNSTSSSSLVSGYNSKNINLKNQFIKSCLKFKPSSVHAWPLISYVSMCLRIPKQNHKKKVFFLFRPTQLKDVKLCTMYHDVLAWNELASKFNLFFSKKLSQEISNIWLRGFFFSNRRLLILPLFKV